MKQNSQHRKPCFNSFLSTPCVLALLASMLLMGLPATAQTDSIRAVVADSATGKPVPAATVYLQTEVGYTIASTTTNNKGSFLFTVHMHQSVQLLISAVGYAGKKVPLSFVTDSTVSRLLPDTIYLPSKLSALKDVVVTANKPLVKQEADRVVYDLQADPDSKSNSVWEMMRKVPFLSVDGQENILLKGSSNYRIFINGKPSGLVERNPKEVLRSIPASTIVSIEVITTPSAKYDAEGLAGIINIITLKKLSNGYSGTVNASERAPAGGPAAGGYFAFKQGKTGMQVLGGGSLYHTPTTATSSIRKSTETPASTLNQASNAESNSRNAYVGTEWSYEPDSLHLLSAQVNFNSSKSNGNLQQATSIFTGNTSRQQYAIANDNTSHGYGLDLGLNYQVGFRKNKNQLLTFSYRYLGNGNTQNAWLTTSNLINFSLPGYQQNNKAYTGENTMQADYVQAVKKWTLEMGVKTIFRHNNSDYEYAAFDSSSISFLVDAARSNTYNNRQQIWSVYNTWQLALQSWTIKAGLRLEQTHTAASFISTASGVQQHYLSAIPAAVISKKWKNNASLSFSYTRRLQRPGINQLNPFVDQSNPSQVSSGNPGLQPAYTDLLQLSYLKSKKATINVAVGCMLFRNLVSRLSTYDPMSDITLLTYGNIGTTRIYKTNIYFSYPITKSWNLRINSDIRYVGAKIITGKGTIENNGWTAYVNTALGYRWGKGWRINTDLTLNSRNITGVQSYINGFALWNSNLQKEIKGKLTFAAIIQNPFAKYRYSRENWFGPDFTQTNTSQLFYRSFSVSINYRFGKLKDAVTKNKRGIKNDDGE